jgi:hypothetical protein
MDPEVAEEQAMEMEALQAIYMEDIEGQGAPASLPLGSNSHLIFSITVLGSSPHEFQIKLVPDGSDSLRTSIQPF